MQSAIVWVVVINFSQKFTNFVCIREKVDAYLSCHF